MEKTIDLKVSADEAAEMRAAIGSMEKGLRLLLKERRHARFWLN
jgi:hypothetical protein